MRALLDHPAARSADSNALADIRAWLGEMSSPVDLPVPAVQQLGWARVRAEWDKTQARLPTDPEGALTAARSLLETVCLHVLESRKVPHKRDGDLQRAFKAATSALGLSTDAPAAGAVRQLLQSCSGAVGALASARNAFADAHGRGQTDPKIGAREAMLAVNVAFSIAQYLVVVSAASPDFKAEYATQILTFPRTPGGESQGPDKEFPHDG